MCSDDPASARGSAKLLLGWSLRWARHNYVVSALVVILAVSSAALAIAEECSKLIQPKHEPTKVRYDGTVPFGTLSLPRDKPCAVFSADLSAGKFFNGLERIRKPHQIQFRKGRQTVLVYPDSIVMEIATFGGCGSGPHSLMGPLPPELQNLRFKAKWIGSVQRDSGYVHSELLTEPWTELGHPRQFYRLQIPAKGVSLTDDLEVRVFSKEGTEIGCMRGHW